MPDALAIDAIAVDVAPFALVSPVEPSRLDLEDIIAAYVAAGSGFPDATGRPACPPLTKLVRRSQSVGPAPQSCYATIQLIGNGQQGVNELSYVRDSRDRERPAILSTQIARYSVQWFREGAGDLGRNFRTWASSPFGRQLAQRFRLTFFGCSELRNLSAIVSAEWEERVGLDVTLGYTEIQVVQERPDCTDPQDLGEIESIEIDVLADGQPARAVNVEC